MGQSARGVYGDVIEEIDWSVGEVMRALSEASLAENTLLFFTSDNGPWLVFGTHGGSAGLLRGGKGMTYEGGMRVPGLAWWPGTIAAGEVSDAVTSTMDLFPTALALADIPMPTDRIFDGRDLSPLLHGISTSEVRDAYFYYRGATLFAARVGPWKAHFTTQWAYVRDSVRTSHALPPLYHLGHDPGEQYNLSAAHPDVLTAIRAAVQAHREELVMPPTQLDARIDEGEQTSDH